MKLILEAVIVELDGVGHIKARLQDCEEAALRLDGTEVDGVRFSFSGNGDSMEMVMEGEGLSEDINTNYPAPPHSPVMQIAFKSPDAKFTANTLNKLMRKANKALKDRALLVRQVKGIL